MYWHTAPSLLQINWKHRHSHPLEEGHSNKEWSRRFTGEPNRANAHAVGTLKKTFFMFHADTETLIKQIYRNKSCTHKKLLHIHPCGRSNNILPSVGMYKLWEFQPACKTCLQNNLYLRLCQETHCTLFRYILLPLHMHTCLIFTCLPSHVLFSPHLSPLLTFSLEQNLELIICFPVF